MAKKSFILGLLCLILVVIIYKGIFWRFPSGNAHQLSVNSEKRNNETENLITVSDKDNRTEGISFSMTDAFYTESDVKSLPKDPEGRQFPACLIVGVRKAGTGALRDFLALHPDIQVPGIEPEFFCKDAIYTKGLVNYRNQMPRCEAGQIVIEKSAEYFHTPGVARRVQAFNSSIKILLIVRDPYDRMLSDYLFLRSYRLYPNNPEKKQPIEELLLDHTTGKIRTKWGCLQKSVYHTYFEEWLQFFPRRQIFIIDGDAYATNPVKELQKVERFLGIRPFLSQNEFYFNKSKNFYCSKSLGCLRQSKGHKLPKLSPAIERRVRKYFRPHNRKFFEVSGRMFNWK